ncbi:MAG TPA: hypothetical protein VF187_00605 [Gemmatimonadales bacterium]
MSGEAGADRRTPCYRSSAPVRLDFAGGWTDVDPFASEERGVVVNAAIELRAEVELRPGGDDYRVESEDLGRTITLADRDPLRTDGPLGLLMAALRRAALGPSALRTRCRAPAGSGLGSSGALDVALVAATDLARGISRPPAELAEEAFLLESVDAGLPGGRQDQYAAALGGIHHLTFERGKVTVRPIALEPSFQTELERHIVICYTGFSRISSRAIERVIEAYRRNDLRVAGALRELVGVAEEMAGALESGDFPRIGRLLDRNWELQQRLDPGMCTPEMAALESVMRRAGALGGKAAGAGAGGSMFFVVEDEPRALRAAEEAGATVIPFTWAAEGVRREAIS